MYLLRILTKQFLTYAFSNQTRKPFLNLSASFQVTKIPIILQSRAPLCATIMHLIKKKINSFASNHQRSSPAVVTSQVLNGIRINGHLLVLYCYYDRCPSPDMSPDAASKRQLISMHTGTQRAQRGGFVIFRFVNGSPARY